MQGLSRQKVDHQVFDFECHDRTPSKVGKLTRHRIGYTKPLSWVPYRKPTAQRPRSERRINFRGTSTLVSMNLFVDMNLFVVCSEG